MVASANKHPLANPLLVFPNPVPAGHVFWEGEITVSVESSEELHGPRFNHKS